MKRKRTNRRWTYLLALLLTAVATYLTSEETAEEQTGTHRFQKEESVESVEIPAPLSHTSEQILQRKAYTVSYNRNLKIANWVAWELTADKLVERVERNDRFLPDPDLPADEAVTTDDYRGSGYDRGHLCPAGDNRWNRKTMEESFYMTNICPQDHNLNSGDWKELEEACRRWARQHGSIYIVCGPVLHGKKHRTIGRAQRVTVPEGFFKVVLCTRTDPPQAIGFVYNNLPADRPLSAYIHTVDQVEELTGIDFFTRLPDECEQQVEATCHPEWWNIKP